MIWGLKDLGIPRFLPNTIICSMLGKYGLAKFCGLLAGGDVCQQRHAEELREGEDGLVHQSQFFPQEVQFRLILFSTQPFCSCKFFSARI